VRKREKREKAITNKIYVTKILVIVFRRKKKKIYKYNVLILC